MSSRSESLARLEALFKIGMRLAQSARSGRVALAQLAAALDPEWIPRPLGQEFLAQLAQAEQTAREPLAGKQVQRILRDAWGSHPSDELDDLDEVPMAVTPSAQVHRGVLDGRPVAVKVLRPGLAASIRQDLALLEALASPLDSAFPALDTAGVLREVRERVLEELDLESEAGTQRRFHRALRGHPFLAVPAPVTSLTHEQVLVSELADGVPLWEAPDPDQAAARYLVFVLGAARWGVAYADPDGDNVLVDGDGRLSIVDFGACRPMDGARLEHATGVLEAVSGEDEAALAERLEALGWLPGEHAPAALELARAIGAELLKPGPSALHTEAVIEARDRLFERAGALFRLMPHGALAPEDLWPARGVAQLFGTIARIGATGDWVTLSLSALRDGWDAAI